PGRDRGPRQGGNHVRRHARRRIRPARGIRRQRRRPRPFPHDGPRGTHDARGSGRPENPGRKGSPAVTAETARRVETGGMIFSPPHRGRVARSAGVVTLAAAGLRLSLCALAQYPSKAIRFVVTFPTGGITDFTARALAPRLGGALGQPVIVENKTDSGGNIGTDFVAKSAPDGHTLLIAAPPNAINVSLYRSLPFDTKKDLAPVALVGS